MRKLVAIVFILVIMISLVVFNNSTAQNNAAKVALQSNKLSDSVSTMPLANKQSAVPRISITAGDNVLYADLFNNKTAESFIELLPITLNAFDRIGLVKSTRLPKSISADGERTRKYVKGAIFYWPEGPEVAFCYSDHLPETVVDIIHIGLIESNIEVFEKYSGAIHIELVKKPFK